MKDIILFYGHYASEQIRSVRGLLSLAVPASNRMRRITQAIRVRGASAWVVSPGISFSAKPQMLFCKKMIERDRGIPLVVIPQCGLRFLGTLLSPLTAVLFLFFIAMKHKVRTVFQYCYYPDAFLFSLVAKNVLGARIVLDLEDICIPRLSDWKPNSETRPIQQVWGYVLMKLSTRLADVVIIPTKRFESFVWTKGVILNISGCQDVRKEGPTERGKRKIVLLYGGAFAFEHGVDLLADALLMLDNQTSAETLEFHMCGRGDKWDWFRDRIKDIRNIRIYCHGYVSNEEFAQIYEQVDVCCVLQRPFGRHSFYKTPSKGYEALCSGKTIIVSDIGDFGELPDEICYKLPAYTVAALVGILEKMTLEDVIKKRMSALRHACANWSLESVHEKMRQTGVLR